MNKRFALLALALVAATVLALPALAQKDAVRATTVTVTAGTPAEFRFKLAKLSAPAGAVTFIVKNSGSLPHDFKILTKKTPLIQPGKSATLKVTLKKGKHPYQCTVSGHAAAGMKGVFTAR